MKLFGIEVLPTTSWDGIGFKRTELENAVRQYLERYNQANIDYPLRQSTWGSLNPDTLTPFAGERSIEVPLSSPDNPFNAIQLTAYKEHFPAYGFGNCRIPTDSEINVIGQVIDHINSQLRDWGMPNIQIYNQLKQSTLPGARIPYNPEKASISISSCGKLSPSVAGYMSRSFFRLIEQENDLRAIPNPSIVLARKNNFWIRPGYRNLVAHEIAHLVGTHPQGVVDLDTLHPDMLQYMCEQPGHHQLGSVLIYKQECLLRGYDADVLTVNLTGDKFGDLELAQMVRFYGNTEAERADSREFAVQRVVQGLRNNYGQKVASHAVAAFCATASKRVLQHAIDQSGASPAAKEKLQSAVNLLSNVLRLAILAQMLGIYSTGVTALGVPIASSVSSTVQSVARLLSAAGLSMLMLSAIRGNSDTLYSLLACLGGQTAGALAGELFNTLCKCSTQRPPEYIDRITSRQLEMSNLADKVGQALQGRAPQKVVDALACISALDKKVAQLVDHYARLGFLYEMLPTTNTPTPHAAAIAQDLSPEQAIEMVVNGTTDNQRMQALEEGHRQIQNLDRHH